MKRQSKAAISGQINCRRVLLALAVRQQNAEWIARHIKRIVELSAQAGREERG